MFNFPVLGMAKD